MIDIDQSIIPIEIYKFDENFPLANWLVKEAKKQNVATDNELKKWMDELTEKSNNNQFFSCINMIVAKGIKQ